MGPVSGAILLGNQPFGGGALVRGQRRIGEAEAFPEARDQALDDRGARAGRSGDAVG